MLNEKVTKEEIEKWLGKIEPMIGKIEAEGEKGKEMLENMKAYISDSKHFTEKGDLVRGFEAVVWAWAIYEICAELGVFSIKS